VVLVGGEEGELGAPALGPRSLFVRKANYRLVQVISARALDRQARALSGRSVTGAETRCADLVTSHAH